MYNRVNSRIINYDVCVALNINCDTPDWPASAQRQNYR